MAAEVGGMKGEPRWLDEDLELLSDDSFRGMDAAQKLDNGGDGNCRCMPPLLRGGMATPESGSAMFHFEASE